MAYSKTDFTAGQLGILAELRRKEATAPDSAIAIKSPTAAAPLVNGYFCQKRSHRPKGGSQTTLYWLTERGQRAARDIKAAS